MANIRPLAAIRVAAKRKSAIALCIVVLAVAVMYARSGWYVSTLVMLLAMTVIFGFSAAMETTWRMYGRRDPEAIRNMGFPPPTEHSGESTFSLIVPAKDEGGVLLHTLETLAKQTHPNVQVIPSLIEGDEDTIEDAMLAHRRYPDRIDIPVVKAYEDEKKPHQLNAALEFCTGEYVGVIDAEDATAEGLVIAVEAAFQRTDTDIVQGPVQLVNLGTKLRHWFRVHNILEYFFWFSSRMMFQAAHRFVPLGGNTVFIKRNLLVRAGGWPISLTEDCALGVYLCTVFGAKVYAAYEPRLATLEETPDDIKGLFWQRVRWDIGFGVELMKMGWLKLPTLHQTLLAWYILITPYFQAATYLFLPITIIASLYLKAPVLLVMLMFLPYIPIALVMLMQCIGLWEFGKVFEEEVRIRHFAFLVCGFFAYQIVLGFAAAVAVYRIVRNNMIWDKTAHSNKHRAVIPFPASAEKVA